MGRICFTLPTKCGGSSLPGVQLGNAGKAALITGFAISHVARPSSGRSAERGSPPTLPLKSRECEEENVNAPHIEAYSSSGWGSKSDSLTHPARIFSPAIKRS